ncbi:transcription factor [Thozetella sp. PMI_491]|nr:transcription factor [Thozetella sp. PMI_491]
MASSAKPRQPRLRASCDGCFLAKVKCSKARPICSRCLACGIECRYSPSSRAGKPKSDANSHAQHQHHHHHHGSSVADLAAMSPLSDDKGMVYPAQQPVPALYKIEAGGWHTPPGSLDGGMSRSQSIASGMALLGVEASPPGAPDSGTVGDIYAAGMPWTPPNDMSSQMGESPVLTSALSRHGHSRSQSYDVAMSASMPNWIDPTGHDMFAYGQQTQVPPATMATNYFPSPSATPNLRAIPRQKPSSSGGPLGSGGSCTCFTACLQSLQALHNASSPGAPPFDLVLSLNRKAVEGCASMLACSRCMSRSGTHTAAMLLGTVIGKITSFYKSASHSYFESGGLSSAISSGTSGLGVSLGVYQVNGEDGRWLELEILARELRKLEEVYSRFREVCADLSEDAEVSKAMLGYLGQTLGSTLEVVHHRRGGDAVYL